VIRVTERRRTRRSQPSRELLTVLGRGLIGDASQHLARDYTAVADEQTISAGVS